MLAPFFTMGSGATSSSGVQDAVWVDVYFQGQMGFTPQGVRQMRVMVGSDRSSL